LGRLEVIVVSYNSLGTIEGCLTSAEAAAAGFDAKITLVDNASADGTVAFVRERFPSVEVIPLERNIGFGPANNVALERSPADFALLLNPDAEISADAVGILLNTLQGRPEVAMVGPKLVYPDGSPQVSFGPFLGLLADFRQRRLVHGCQKRRRRALRRVQKLLNAPFLPDWIGAACCLARMDALRDVGFFYPKFFLYFEDVDLCRRLRMAGKRVMLQPEAQCKHREGSTQPDKDRMRLCSRRSRLLYENRHGTRLGFLVYKLLRARKIDYKYDPSERFEPSERGLR
jgi:GT2 family glycosyltransferase